MSPHLVDRRAAALVIGSGVLVVLLVLRCNRQAPPRPGAARARAAEAHSPRMSFPEVGDRQAQAEDPKAELPPQQPPREQTEAYVRQFREFRVQALRQAARFPGDSDPLTDRHLDALTKVVPDHSRGGGPGEPDEARGDRLRAYAARPFFPHDAPIILHADVINGITGAPLSASIEGVVARRSSDGVEGLVTIAYRDDGQGGDPAAGDRHYTAVVDRALLPAELVGIVPVEVTAYLDDGRERFVVSAFRFGSPPGRLTGRFDDHIADGHLIVTAEVTVEKPGRYHLQGGLVASDGSNLAWSQYAEVFAKPGTFTMPMRFFGLILYEAGIPGPYKLDFVSLAFTEAMPVIQGPVLRDAHTTAAYSLDQFSSEPSFDPNMEAVIRQAEGLRDSPVPRLE